MELQQPQQMCCNLITTKSYFQNQQNKIFFVICLSTTSWNLWFNEWSFWLIYNFLGGSIGSIFRCLNTSYGFTNFDKTTAQQNTTKHMCIFKGQSVFWYQYLPFTDTQWNPQDTLVAPVVVITITLGVISNDRFGIMTTIGFQCHCATLPRPNLRSGDLMGAGWFQ